VNIIEIAQKQARFSFDKRSHQLQNVLFDFQKLFQGSMGNTMKKNPYDRTLTGIKANWITHQNGFILMGCTDVHYSKEK
jgi:hypothetical protein